MARKRKNSFFDGRSQKRSNPFQPKKIADLPPRKHWSFRLPQLEEDKAFCSPFDDGDEVPEGVGRRPGTTVSYSPIQTERYQSQYLRYMRGAKLTPDKIEEEEDTGIIRYYYQSCDAPNGFWIVTVTPEPDEILIDAGPDLIEICSERIYVFGFVFPFDTPVIWTQVSGQPVTMYDTDKTLMYFDRGGSVGPYEFRISAVSDPEIYDEMVVWTTPVSIYPGNISVIGAHTYSYPDCAVPPCRIYLAPSIPPVTQAFCVEPGVQLTIRWDEPTCYSQYLYEIQVQTNTGSGWTVVDTIDPTDDHYTVVTQGQYYRVVYRYDRGLVYGEDSFVDIPGCSFNVELENHTLLSDQIYDGASLLGGYSLVNEYGLVTISGTDESWISVGGGDSDNNEYQSIILNELDTYQGVSVGGRSSSVTEYALGGIVIG